MSKRLRKVTYALVVLFVAAVVVLGVISTPWVQRYFERRVVTELEALTGARIATREFHFRPLILQFVFRGLVLRGKEPASEAPLFSGETVVVQVNPTSLLQWKLRLRSIDWDGATIHIYTYSDGSTNLPEPEPQRNKPDGKEADVTIGRVALSHTQLFWNTQRLQLDLGARDVAILARRTPQHKYVGTLSSQEIRIRPRTMSFPPCSISTRFEFDASGLELTSASWKCAEIRGTANLALSNWTKPELRLSYGASGDIKELFRQMGVRELQGGTIESQGTLKYAQQNLEGEGRLQARELIVQTPTAKLSGVSLSMEYSATSSRIHFTRIAGTALGGSFQGSGEVSLQTPSPQAELRSTVEGLSIQRIVEALGRPTGAWSGVRFSSRLSGTVQASWRGRFERFLSRYSLELNSETGVSGATLPLTGSVKGTARLTPGLALEIAAAGLRTPGSNISAQGTIGETAVRLALQVRTRKLEEWQPLLGYATEKPNSFPIRTESESRFRGTLAGSLREPEIRGRLESGPFIYRGWRWESMLADIALSPRQLEITSAQLKNKGSALSLRASLPLKDWRLKEDGQLRLSVSAERTRVEGLLSALEVDFPLTGCLNGQLSLGGTAGDMSGTGGLNIQNGALGGEPFDSLSTDLRVTHSALRLEEFRLKKGGGLALGQAEVALSTRTLQAALHASGFDLSDFRHLMPADGSGPRPGVKGSLSLEFIASGPFDNLDTAASVTINDIAAGGIPIGTLQARVTKHGRQLNIQGKAEGSAGKMDFSGLGLCTGDWPLELSGSFAALHIEPWLQLLSPRKTGPTLITEGVFQGNVPLKHLEQLDLRLQAKNLSINYPNLAWSSPEPVSVRYAKGQIAVDRFRLRGPATNIEVEGSVFLGQTKSLSFTVEGNAEATLLSLIDPALQASGKSTVQLRVTGSLAHPAVTGKLGIQDVSAGYGDLPFRITALEGEITLEGERATLKALRGTSGGGTVTLNGFATLGEVPRFSLQANLSQVRLRYPSDFTSLLDGTLHLIGSAEHGQISGDVTVRQVFPAENFNWLARAGEWGGRAATPGPAISSPFAPKIRLNIQISSASSVRFEARDLRLLADIDVRLQGTLANPVQVGTIQILSGAAVFRGNRYTIRRGDLKMSNPFRTQPVLGLEAQTRIQHYELAVNISGPFDRLKIAYRSDPPLSTEDIVTLLAFGYARQQEAMATGVTHPVATVGASALLSEALSTQVSGRIQRLFGVSRIKIDPNVGGIGTTGGARITVEQQVTPELTVTYLTNTNSSQQRIIQLEWAVTDKISLLGERDQNGVLGTEIRFRQRFK